MAVPKRRHSKSRSRKRRSQDALKPRQISRCPRCGEAKLPHRVCGNCGFYKGEEVVAFEE